MKEFGVGNKAILLLRRKINVAGTRVHGYLLCRTFDNVLHLFSQFRIDAAGRRDDASPNLG